MKKTMIFKVAAAACVVALLVCTFLIFGHNFRLGTHYADAEQYTAGGATVTDPVNNLDIHWTEGLVTIAYHADNTIEISETAPKAISGDAQLRWWLDGTTLHIQYAKSGYFSLLSLKKELTVTLPEGFELEGCSVEATSADVKIPSLRAKNMVMNLTSGDLDLAQAGAESVALSSTSGDLFAGLEEAKTVSVDTTSGEIQLTQTGAAQSVSLSSTSGDIRATLGDADELQVSSTSGRVAVEAGTTKKADIGTTSGNITVRLAAFDQLKIGSTSGDVTAALPSKPGFKAEIDTTSGSFDSAIALKRDGDRYACGDESASLEIDTTSGDIRLEEAQ